MRRFEALLLALTLSISSTGAWAEPTKEDIATAKAAIREARELRDKGKHAESLPKFKAAYSLVPTPLTALELARAHLALVQLIEAREVLVIIGAMPKLPTEKIEHEEARKEAAELLPKVTARVSELSVTLEGDGKGIVVAIDGQELKSATLSVPRKLNPGKHVVVARRGAEVVFTVDVTLAEAEQRTVKVKVPVEAEPAKVVDARPPKETPTPPPRTQRTVGLVLGGLGIVGAGVGTWFYLSGSAQYDENIAKCGPDGCPKAEGQAAEAGTSRARAGLAMGAAGLLIAGAGVVLYVLAPAPNAPTVTLGPSGITLRGSF